MRTGGQPVPIPVGTHNVHTLPLSLPYDAPRPRPLTSPSWQVDGAEVRIPSSDLVAFDVFAASGLAGIASQLAGKHHVEVLAAAPMPPVITLQEGRAFSEHVSSIDLQQLCATHAS